MITTEGPEFSDRYHQTVLDEVRKTGATLHSFIFDQPSTPLFDSGRWEREFTLAKGAKETGGRREYLLTSMALGDRLRELSAELRNRYPNRLFPSRVSDRSRERRRDQRQRAGLTARGAQAWTSEGWRVPDIDADVKSAAYATHRPARRGAAPLIRAIRNARKSVDAVIFAAIWRRSRKRSKRRWGVASWCGLIAHTNRGGEKELRKLERRLLKAGVTVARTDDDLIRYHGKLLVIDGRRLFVMGFNYTELDLQKSRSFGVVTRSRKLIADAGRLIEADSNRQNFKPSPRGLVVSPENARQRLSRFIRKTRRELLIYDPNVADDDILQLLKTRANAGVRVRILGKVEEVDGCRFQNPKFPGRLHVRALVRDGRRAFVGSQSLVKPELDERREVGIVIPRRAAREAARERVRCGLDAREKGRRERRSSSAALQGCHSAPAIAAASARNAASISA